MAAERSQVGAAGMCGRTGLPSHAAWWLVGVGLGLLAGYLVGLGAIGGHTHVGWPALAGCVLGVAASLTARTGRLLVASCGAGTAVAVAASVAQIAAARLQDGRWPIPGETAAHYGTTTQAIVRAAVVLGVAIGVPCLLCALVVVVARRRDRHVGLSDQ